MTQNTSNNKNQNEVFIKFHMPKRLKEALQDKAVERNIALSALMRIIATDYVKRTQ